MSHDLVASLEVLYRKQHDDRDDSSYRLQGGLPVGREERDALARRSGCPDQPENYPGR